MRGPTNYQLKQLISELEGTQNAFWRRIRSDLLKPRRNQRVANLYKISKNAREGEIIVVPGKVLSVGEISKKVLVAALSFSGNAQKKINEAKGKTITLEQLYKENPEGKNVRIL